MSSIYQNPYQRRFYKIVLRLLLLIIYKQHGNMLERSEQHWVNEAYHLIDEL